MTTPISQRQLSQQIKDRAARLGFDLCRIVPAGQALHADFYEMWARPERVGDMIYLTRHGDKRRDPSLLSDDPAVPFRSVIVLAVNYHQFELPAALRDDPSRGVIASYAWGEDYHDIIRPLLYELDGFIRSQTGRATPGKALVDTGPVLERDWAHQAGLGFIGKNCCLIRPGMGSWLFLATLSIPEILAYDAPVASNQDAWPAPQAVFDGLPMDGEYGSWIIPSAGSNPKISPAPGEDAPRVGTCGRCTRCIRACPTGAFAGPYHLEPLRCISYWTIEARGAIPQELRTHFGNRIFGCDICQEVCPWNRRLPETTPLLNSLRARSQWLAPPLLEGFQPETPYWLRADAFSRRFRRSPIKRAKRHGMLRNVCVALGNWGDLAALPALALALDDVHPLPRGHAAWALGQLLRRHHSVTAREHLQTRLQMEEDAWVIDEIRLALTGQ